jgi:hypothetical protein
MSLAALGGILDFGGKLIDRLIPDPAQKLAAQQELMKMALDKELAVMANETKLITAQTDINAIEAKSDKFFVSGWRPSIGWVCSAALCYQYLLRPIGGAAYILITGHAMPVELPGLDDNLWELLAGLLGLAGLRTAEKMKRLK